MADTGWLSPTSSAGTDWTNANNIYSSNNVDASWSSTAIQTSPILYGYGFNFGDIPAGATIDGIEVTVEHSSSATTSLDVENVKLYTDTTAKSADKEAGTTLSQTESTETYGSPTDTWSWTGITDADFTTSFRVGVEYSTATSSNRTAYVDHIQVKVYYTETNQAPIAVAGDDQSGVEIGTTITITGSASYDPDGDAIGWYYWTLIEQPAGSTLYDGVIESMGLDHTPIVAGEYIYSLAVKDEHGLISEYDYVSIFVIDPDATDTGEKFATDNTQKDYSGGSVWVNPTNTYVDDSGNTYAYSVIPDTYSDWLFLRGFDFSSIPSNADITGYEVKIEAIASNSNAIEDWTVQLAQDTTEIGDNKGTATTLGTSWGTWLTYGGENDLWGTTLTASDVKSSTFGVGMVYESSDGADRTIYVNAVTLTIYYSGTLITATFMLNMSAF